MSDKLQFGDDAPHSNVRDKLKFVEHFTGGHMPDKTLTVALMDPPYESANSTTALRIIAAALKKGINVNVFAYEGAVNLAFKDQAPHANPVKGTSVEEEDHPTTKNFVASLLEIGNANPRLTWVNCGLCVDERGAGNSVEGVKRGGPGDLLKMAQESTNTLVIPAK